MTTTASLVRPSIAYLDAVRPGILSGKYDEHDWVYEHHPVTYVRVLNRHSLVKQYSWSIPSIEALHAIARFSKSIVEVGAGTGYWAHLLQQCGVDVLCYDEHPPATGVNTYGHSRQYAEIQSGSCLSAEAHADRTLMLSWPPYTETMAHDTLQAYLRASGKSLVYIGESWGGCCGNDAFFRLVKSTMELVATIDLLQWCGLHDAVFLYKRRHFTSPIDIANVERKLSAR